MNLLRLQLGASLVDIGLRHLNSGQPARAAHLINQGLACLKTLLEDEETEQRRIA